MPYLTSRIFILVTVQAMPRTFGSGISALDSCNNCRFLQPRLLASWAANPIIDMPGGGRRGRSMLLRRVGMGRRHPRRTAPRGSCRSNVAQDWRKPRKSLSVRLPLCLLLSAPSPAKCLRASSEKPTKHLQKAPVRQPGCDWCQLSSPLSDSRKGLLPARCSCTPQRCSVYKARGLCGQIPNRDISIRGSAFDGYQLTEENIYVVLPLPSERHRDFHQEIIDRHHKAGDLNRGH